jgi:hypothetical protein
MVDTTVLDDRLATLLAGDTTTLAQAANANYIALVVVPFSPGPNLDFTGLTEATFAGYAALACGLNAQNVFNDPTTGLRLIELVPPVGGWQFTSTGATSPTQTVYGWCLVNHAKTVTYGGGLLPTPVQIQNTGDGVNLGSLGFGLIRNSVK